MIAIVCHDAGGAELVSSWVRRNNASCCFVLDGPAVAIFQKKLGICNVIGLDEAISKCDWVLCGTGWASSLERDAIAFAKASGKSVVAFLDHWVNYNERFLQNGQYVLPDEIWVGDAYASDLAIDAFPLVPVCLHENPYLLDLKERIGAFSKPRMKAKEILYVCEPLKEHSLKRYGDERYWGYTEDDAIRYFLSHSKLLGFGQHRIRLRLHPSESPGKYDWVTGMHAEGISISDNHDLLADIMMSDAVVGCTSMAMVVGLMAGKRVVSVVPPGGKPCSLPYREIEHLQSIVNNNSGGHYA